MAVADTEQLKKKLFRSARQILDGVGNGGHNKAAYKIAKEEQDAVKLKQHLESSFGFIRQNPTLLNFISDPNIIRKFLLNLDKASNCEALHKALVDGKVADKNINWNNPTNRERLQNIFMQHAMYDQQAFNALQDHLLEQYANIGREASHPHRTYEEKLEIAANNLYHEVGGFAQAKASQLRYQQEAKWIGGLVARLLTALNDIFSITADPTFEVEPVDPEQQNKDYEKYMGERYGGTAKIGN